MSWHRYLQIRTRDPQWLWQLAIGIVVAGALAGFLVQWLPGGIRGRLEPDTQEAQATVAHCQALADLGSWRELALAIPRTMWLGWFPGPTLIAALTGICWFLLLLQAGQANSARGVRAWLCLIGVGLGIASIWPTLFTIYWQESAWGLEKSTELGPGLLYFVLGVGLREEICKLVLFLPLLPFVVARGNEREALLVAASVGLGFAIEENVGYFTGNAGESVGRFLSANIFHMSLTGLAGLAVCRAIWNPRQMAGEALGVFLLLIMAHGLYDAFIVLSELQQIAFGGFVIYLLLVYQFFHELRSWWNSQASAISLSATVVASTAIVFALTFTYLSALYDFNAAMSLAGIPAVQSLIFVYVVLREVPESLVR